MMVIKASSAIRTDFATREKPTLVPVRNDWIPRDDQEYSSALMRLLSESRKPRMRMDSPTGLKAGRLHRLLIV